MGPMTTWLNSAPVQTALGVTGVTWAPCSNSVNGQVSARRWEVHSVLFPALLAHTHVRTVCSGGAQ